MPFVRVRADVALSRRAHRSEIVPTRDIVSLMRLAITLRGTMWRAAAAATALLGSIAACAAFGADSEPAAAGGGDAGDAGDLAPNALPSLNCPAGCLPPAPPGWTGPAAVYDGPFAAHPPACPAAYGRLDLTAHGGVDAGSAICTCGTAAPVVTCTVVVSRSAAPDCSNPSTATLTLGPTKGAICIGEGATSFLRVSTPVLDAGCVFPDASTVKPPPSYARSSVACGIVAEVACPSRADCTTTQPPDAPFGQICIHTAGDVACPSADYSHKLVAYRGLADTRDCSKCAAAPSAVSCGTSFLTSGDGCDGGTASSTFDTCFARTMVGSVSIDPGGLRPQQGTCGATTGGQPAGAAQSTGPVTFCCN